ncbi:MAG: cytochrome c oxidase subunit II [Deltaproteobacteria bacterium]|nr:cytochrome c oxidase subunit II [Deltaproteobacteria bacterium]
MSTSTGEFFDDYMRHALFLPDQASSFAKSVDHLHYFVILTTFAGGTGVGLAALYFFVRYKRRKGAKPRSPHPLPAALELMFIGVPLALFLLWFAMGISLFKQITTAPDDAMEVYVTAKQWMWEFSYPEGPVSQGVLHVPVGRPVKLLMTSRDVIHSFYVPAFRTKRDVLPGRYTDVWFAAVSPGTYDVYCTQYCGTNHSFMRAQVIAMPQAEYDTWFRNQLRGLARRDDASAPGADGIGHVSSPLREQGEAVAAAHGCFKCHTIDGTPHIGPTWLGMYGRQEVMSDGTHLTVDDPYMTESMMDPEAKIVAGFQPVMPSFQGKLTPLEVAAILEYIKSLDAPGLTARASAGPRYELR